MSTGPTASGEGTLHTLVAKAPGSSAPEGPRAGAAADWLAAAGLVALLAWAAALRAWACQTELWLDEVWSVLLVRELGSPLGVLGAIHHDNNHYLNSWFLQAIGEPRAFFVYRLHSLVAGVGTVVLACVWARGLGRAGPLLAALLLGNSYLLVHYASEARGYALLLFFAVASLLVTRRFLSRRRPADTALYALCAIGGFLSHLSFLHVFLGIAAWTAMALPKATAPRREAARRWLGYQVLPLLFLVGLWLVDLRFLRVGGGPDYRLGEVVVSALSYGVGGPGAGVGAWLAAGAAVLACGVALAALRREGGDEWVGLFVAAVASPALLLLATEPEVLFVRYFLVSVAFGLLLLTDLAARVAARGRAAAWAVGGVAACVALGNGLHTATLLRDGRGSFHAALRTIVEHETTDTITLGGINERRDAMLFAFYAPHLPSDKSLRYLPPEDWSREPPAWLLLSRPDRRLPPREEAVLEGQRYRRFASFSSAVLSGRDWFVYRLEPGPAASP